MDFSDFPLDAWMETRSGKQFNFFNPHPDMIDIEDIVSPLSKSCRYNGQTQDHLFYSVAEHCVHIARWILSNGWGPKNALTGLMHDGAEAYIGDMVRPFKIHDPVFMEVERRIDHCLGHKFPIFYPWPPIVKELDSRILVDERAQLMAATDNVWVTDDLEPMGIELQCWNPTEAHDEFYTMYWDLMAQVARAGLL